MSLGKMKNIKFFKLCCCLTMFTGFLSFLGSNNLSQIPWLKVFNILGPASKNISEFSKEAFVLNAIIGGVMIGWGATMFFLADEIFKNRTVWRAVLAGLYVWFCFDSLGSFFAGFYLNIAFNLIFLLVFHIAMFREPLGK